MTDVFLKIVNMSISAGWLVLAVLVLRPALRKAPRWVHVLLWGLVAVRLLCPISPESAWSLIPRAEPISPELVQAAAPVIDAGTPPISTVGTPVFSETSVPEAVNSKTTLQILLPVLAALWLIGAASLVSYAAISYGRLRRRVASAVRLRDNLYQSEAVASPFVLGIVKPNIYLPFSLNGEAMAYVVAHEQAHICRKDHWWKPLGFLLLAVYWFHPLMWVAYVLLCRDIELACDEKVIRELEKEQRADYSQALLSCSTGRKRVAACPLAFGEVGVKARVKSVLRYQKPALWVIAASVVVCAAVAVCFLTNPEEPHFDFEANPVVSAIATYAEHPENPLEKIVRPLSEEEIQTLQARLPALSGLKKTTENTAATLAAVELSLADGGSVNLQCLDDGSLRLLCNPGTELYLVHDEEFRRYVLELCSGGETAAEESAVRWVFSPMMSASWHAFFYFRFDLRYSHVEAACDRGELWNLEAEGQPGGKTMRFEAGEPLCWFPMLKDRAEEAEISFIVYDGEEALYTGTLEITCTGSENGQSFYEARLADSDLLSLRQQEANSGALLTKSDTAAILAYSDLNRNRVSEQIVVRETEPGMLWEVSVLENGRKLWSAEAGTAHMGWNTVMLCSVDGQDCLVEYQPAVFQGVGHYTCTVFSLENGEKTVKQEWSADFTLPVRETEELERFAREVGLLLRGCTVLLTTEQGTVPSPYTMAATDLPQLYPVRFDPDEIQSAMEQTASPVLTDQASEFPAQPLELLFSGGAGAWRTELTLQPDGSFSGTYEDADMGNSTPDYPGGTCHISRFSGQFTGIRQISDHAWRMELTQLETERPEGESWVEDGIRWIAAAPYGMDGGEVFSLYAPSAPADTLTASFCSWWPSYALWRKGEIEQLGEWGLYNEKAGCGFFQSRR